MRRPCLLADAPCESLSPSAQLWSPVPPPSALRDDVAEAVGTAEDRTLAIQAPEARVGLPARLTYCHMTIHAPTPLCICHSAAATPLTLASSMSVCIRYNNADTNALVQAEYKIAFPQREWHVPGTLASHGLNLKAFDALRLIDFKIDDLAQPCALLPLPA